MGQLIKVFKPDTSAVWASVGMVVFGLIVILAGFLAHNPMVASGGLVLITIFAFLAFRQPSQTIQIYSDRVVFLYPGQDSWTIPFESFGKLEVITTWKNASKLSPGRTILLRFLDNDDVLSAEANVNVFDKTAVSSMIKLIQAGKPDLLLNKQAQELLQITTAKGITIGAVTETE